MACVWRSVDRSSPAAGTRFLRLPPSRSPSEETIARRGCCRTGLFDAGLSRSPSLLAALHRRHLPPRAIRNSLMFSGPAAPVRARISLSYPVPRRWPAVSMGREQPIVDPLRESRMSHRRTGVHAPVSSAAAFALGCAPYHRRPNLRGRPARPYPSRLRLCRLRDGRIHRRAQYLAIPPARWCRPVGRIPPGSPKPADFPQAR